MLQNTKIVIQSHTVLDRRQVRRQFYTVEMEQNEQTLNYVDRVQHFASSLKSMGFENDSKEPAMGTLKGLLAEYEKIVKTLDAFEDNKDLFTFDLNKSRLWKEGNKKKLKYRNTSKIALATVPRAQQLGCKTLFCLRRKQRGHHETARCDNYPSLHPCITSTIGSRNQN